MNDSPQEQLLKLIGARHAFGVMAGRCTAADAGILRDIRDNKRYIPFSETWDNFCARHLRMSKRNANRLIALLNELGPGFFALAHLTQMTPEEFRRFRPSVQENRLEYRGEAIALIEENAGRLADVVGEMRQAAELPEPRSAMEEEMVRYCRQYEALHKLLERAMAALRKAVRTAPPKGYGWFAELDFVRDELAAAQRELDSGK